MGTLLVGVTNCASSKALSRFLIAVGASLLPSRYLRDDPSGFTPDREGLVSAFSVLSCCEKVTVGVEGSVRRRM